jgi:hypothetical protein
MSWKPIEPTLHRIMGFGAMLTNTRLLLTRREDKQLPPENDRYPVKLIYKDILAGEADEYWSKIRTMDTFGDSKQYDQGGAVAWPVLVGLSVAAGWSLHRWLG